MPILHGIKSSKKRLAILLFRVIIASGWLPIDFTITMELKRIAWMVFMATMLTINIGCDRVTKTIVRQQMADFERVSLLNNHLTILRVENTGAFLSIGHSLPPTIRIWLLIILPLIILIITVVFLFASPRISRITQLGVCFVIGGGIGNLCDRIFYGSVTDFLHIDAGLFQTGIFNMADVSIMMGLLIVVSDVVFRRGDSMQNRFGKQAGS